MRTALVAIGIAAQTAFWWQYLGSAIPWPTAFWPRSAKTISVCGASDAAVRTATLPRS